MSDTSVIKIDSSYSPEGDGGQKYLASGKTVSMRLWENVPPQKNKTSSVRDYETVGYVLEGLARLYIGDQVITLHPGDSWVVPRDTAHRYEILKPFTALEATSPPSQVHGRDESPSEAAPS